MAEQNTNILEKGGLPDGWDFLPISKVAKFSRGISWWKADEWEGGNLVISIPNIRDGFIDFDSKFNHYLKIAIPENKRLFIWDVVFVWSSWSLQNVWRNALVSYLQKEITAFASFAFKASPNTAIIDNNFFYFLCNSSQVAFHRHTKRAADWKYNFQLRSFESEQYVPLAPLKEQKVIVEILSSIQSAISEQKNLVEKLRELKRSMMHELFTRGTRGEKVRMTEIGEVPESWENIELGKVVHFKTGKLNSNAAEQDGIYPFFTCSQETFKINSYAFDCEALLLSGNNARAIYSVKHFIGKFNAYQRTYVITLKDLSNNYLFMKYLLEMSLERFQWLSIGSSTKYLTLGILQNLKILLPDIKEQFAIGEVLNSIDQKTEVHVEKLNSLESLFKTLLHELVSGERRVGV